MNKIIKLPTSFNDCILNAKQNYTTQFKSKRTYSRFLYLHHRNGNYYYINGFQIKMIDNVIFIILLLDYSKKFMEKLDIDYYQNIFNFNSLINDTSLKISVFKNKNSKNNIFYADDIKRVLLNKLFNDFPGATFVSEFKILNTIVDIAMFYQNKIYFFEIKSSQDSFTRLEKQIIDYVKFSHYSYLVIDDSKINSYINKYNFDNVGLYSFKEKRLLCLKKSKKSTINHSLFFLLWSKELKSAVKSIPYSSKLNPILIEIYFRLVFKDINSINDFVFFTLFNRYKKYSDNLKISQNNLSKGFLKPFEGNRLIDFLDYDFISVKDFLMQLNKNFNLFYFKNKFLMSLLSFDNVKFEDLNSHNFFVAHKHLSLQEFIIFSLKELNISRNLYTDFEIRFFLFFLYKKRILNKFIKKFKLI